MDSTKECAQQRMELLTKITEHIDNDPLLSQALMENSLGRQVFDEYHIPMVIEGNLIVSNQYVDKDYPTVLDDVQDTDDVHYSNPDLYENPTTNSSSEAPIALALLLYTDESSFLQNGPIDAKDTS